ncbi:hypothetical protein BJ322DRAFT_1030862 [Thelephora terrestris]|uniref:BRCT domain-containing protein n=1 Tax=Thelephora terrestris TaxID=56493 RepID=A0A9P6HRR9_9AGAM|nr:hypothetical protein BJ322DRAFT_1030862 [Thelephora terrestris]
MAPPRNSSRRPQSANPVQDESVQSDLFLEPMMGNPLAIYVDKDVQDRDTVVDLIINHGGMVSPSYSGVPYILVDPHRESGQSLYRQYAGKKGKIVLHAQWVHKCIEAGVLQTYHTSWAGCKVNGSEPVNPPAPPPTSQSRQPVETNTVPTTLHPTTLHQVMPQPQTIQPSESLVHHSVPTFPYHIYPATIEPPRSIHVTTPPQWPNGIPPHHAHIPQMMSRPDHYREDQWNAVYAQPPPHAIQSAEYDYNRYRDAHAAWVAGPNDYYTPGYEQAYEQTAPYMSDPGPSTTTDAEPFPATEPSNSTPAETDKARGRKRAKAQPAPPTSSLVVSRGQGTARSPTPPTRVIKSTYGGNLFTADDVLYLKKYIDYCQEQGLVLSLREICERVAVKAPHHTFYSWRRYCNKHQIRLGGYTMIDRSLSPGPERQGGADDMDTDETQSNPPNVPGPETIAAARSRAREDRDNGRTRSPTPPRALFRSTTGKGVAFTEEDVTFLVRFMEFKKAQERFDMVTFWKDVATKAPHHSRASWMKFYRRHKHELHHEEGDEPLPAVPEKKMRYSRSDDILLARFFALRPEGTSDKVFQTFARQHSHHPWKGWQEHHRIHKAKIDNLIQRLGHGEDISDTDI